MMGVSNNYSSTVYTPGMLIIVLNAVTGRRTLQWSEKSAKDGSVSSDCSYDEHGVFPVQHLEQQVTGRCEYEAADTGATVRDANSKCTPLVEVVADSDDRRQKHQS